MKKIVALVFIDYYLPGHKAGGPIRTIENMINVMGDNVEFKIITLDRDILDDVPYDSVKSEEWVRFGGASVFYISPNRFSFGKIKKIVSDVDYDWIYLNSLFSPKFTIMPILLWRLGYIKNNILLAPRGELSKGALSIKPIKKNIFLKLANFFNLFSGIRWQASSDEEVCTIKDAFPAASDIVVARDLPDYSILDKGPSVLNVHDELRVIFLSRISPKKNLDFALKVLENVGVKVRFDIWGTEEDSDYWDYCKSLFDGLPSNVAVSYMGVAQHKDVPVIMGGYDLFFFPTLGENYGHVIAEAVSVGTPVLISDRTPWRGLRGFGAGWDISLEGGVKPFCDAIEEAFLKTRNQVDIQSWRLSTYIYASNFLKSPNIISDNVKLFSEKSCK